MLKSFHVHSNVGQADKVNSVLESEGFLSMNPEKVSGEANVTTLIKAMRNFTEENKPNVIFINADTKWHKEDLHAAGISTGSHTSFYKTEAQEQGVVIAGMIKNNEFPALKNIPVVIYGAQKAMIKRDPRIQGFKAMEVSYGTRLVNSMAAAISNISNRSGESSNVLWGSENQYIVNSAVKKLNESSLGKYFEFKDGAKISGDARKPSTITVGDKPGLNILSLSEKQDIVTEMTGLKAGVLQPQQNEIFDFNLLISRNKLQNLEVKPASEITKVFENILDKRKKSEDIDKMHDDIEVINALVKTTKEPDIKQVVLSKVSEIKVGGNKYLGG